MIWKIAKKEFLLNLMTFKFAVGTILCVVLIALFMPVLLKDYRERLKEYNENTAANEAELRKAKVYDNILMEYTICRPPTVLSVFSKGVENRLSNSAPIKMSAIPEISASTKEINPYVSILPVLDISLVFKIVISALVLLIACDVVSGDREKGTLKLMLSGSISRHIVLVGKLLGGLMTLLIPLTIAFLVGILVLLLSPVVDLTASEWLRIALIYIASLIFVSAMYNIGLFISSLTKNSATSLIIGLFFWVIFIMVVPNASVYLASKIRPFEPEEKTNSQLEIIGKKQSSERDNVNEQLPFAGKEVAHFEKSFFRWYWLVCNKEAMEWRLKREPLWRPISIKYADKFWEIKHLSVETLFRQKQLADSFSQISPVSLYENVMSALAGTDAAGCQNFIDSARTHRNAVVEYIRSKTNNFSSPSYFTQCTEDDIALYEQYLDKEISEEVFQNWKQKKIAQMQPLDLRDFPQFIYKPGAVKVLQRSMLYLLPLVLINVLFFVLSFVAFLKYDVR